MAVSEALRWIAIWGFDNPWGEKAKAEKPRLAGKDIVDLTKGGIRLEFLSDTVGITQRLAAAVSVPLHFSDREKVFRAVSLPQGKSKNQQTTATQTP